MTTKRKAFVYSIDNEEVVVKEGFVYTFATVYFGDTLSFFHKKDYDINDSTVPDMFNENYRVDNYHGVVSNSPGHLYNSVVWFEEREDSKAVDILLKNKLERLMYFQNKAKTILKDIKILELPMREELSK